ncbi:MAG: hypothetical protein ACE5IC_00060 [Candidatus Brocadiales bacterium]
MKKAVKRDLQELIPLVTKLPSIHVELCGSWLWITGETFPIKAELKALGFKWSKKKSAWYYHNGRYRKKSRHPWSLDKIRTRFGSVEYLEQEEKATV